MTSDVFADADDELAQELASRLRSGAFTLFSGVPAPELARMDPGLDLAEWALCEPEAVVQAYSLRQSAGAHVALVDLGSGFDAAEKRTGLDCACVTDALVRACKRAGFRYVACAVRSERDAGRFASWPVAAGVHLLVFEGLRELGSEPEGWSRPYALHARDGARLVVHDPQGSFATEPEKCVVPLGTHAASDVARFFCRGENPRSL